MGNEPSTQTHDPYDRLHEAIASFEEAIDAALDPDPQVWLERYPEVASRLAEFFAAQKGLKQLANPLLPPPEPTPGPPPCLADYEGLTEIGRGGMGVVYRARQLSLARDVALKVIRRDRLEEGSPAERQQWIDRFRMEAQLVATLDHPHIVPVYEVGEQDGHHYFSMKLIDGGSLKERLGRYTSDPRAAAGLLVQVTQAVHHAHQRALLHRDLKPGNILVDAQGQPHVTDFGLAKRLQTGGGLTQSGALVGTLEYMAPEQAASRKDLSTAVDVWALGAILYELLTGRVPFRGDTLVDTLRQVMEKEPVPPRRLQPMVPRDLDTICLKCLEKDPRKRYGSAEELAGRLRLFLENKPIPDRPVSSRERLWRWCRRNRAVAALLGSVALVLLLGTAVSTYFAFDAAEQTGRADKRAEEVDKANEELKGTVDQLLGMTGRGLLSPLGHKERLLKPTVLGGKLVDPDAPLTEPEVEALWELASTREERLRLRFVEEALRGPTTTRQLSNRAEFALHAAVGLDARRRAKAERLLLANLQDRSLVEKQRRHVALVLAALGNLSPDTAASVSTTLEASLCQVHDAVGQAALARGLALVVSRLEPNDAATAAPALAAHLTKVDDPNVQAPLVSAMKAVTARLQPRQLAAVGNSLAAALKGQEQWRKGAIWEALGAVAGRLDPQKAARLAADASAALPRVTALGLGGRTGLENQERLWELTLGLAAVAPHLDPNAAEIGGAALINALLRQPGQAAAPGLVDVLTAVSRRMEPKTADRLFAAAGEEFLRLLPLMDDEFNRRQQISRLAVVAPRLKAKVAADAGALMAAALPRVDRNEREAKILSRGLAAVAARLEPKEVGRLGTALTESLRKWGTGQYGTEVASTLEAVARRLKSHEGDQLYADVKATVVADLTGQKAIDMDGIAELLAAVARHYPPEQAGELAFAFADALGRDTRGPRPETAAVALAAMASRLKPKDARRLGSVLTAALTKMGNPEHQCVLAHSLAAVAGYLEPADAARLCATACTACADTVAKATDPGVPALLVPALAAMAAHLEPTESSRLCATLGASLAAALPKTTDCVHQSYLAGALAAVGTRQDPNVAAKLCGEASVTLVTGLSKTLDDANRCALAGGLVAVARWLEPRAASEVSAILSESLISIPDARPRVPEPTTVHIFLAEALAAVAGRMKPEDGTATLIEALRRTESPQAHEKLVQGLRTILLTNNAAEVTRKALATSTFVASMCGGAEEPLQALAFIGKATEALPSRLSPQQLVNLLKHPLCIGPARRVILDQLGMHYDQDFADQWDFVHFAEERNLELDLTSPPRRPTR
jgi:serine/threonine protein kinase